jgi:hypothetical protein
MAAMRVLRWGWVSAALVASVVTAIPAVAHADDATCVAASENDVALRKQNKLREALKQLLVCAAPSCPAEVKTECDRRLVVLTAALPSLVLRATDGAGNDLVAVSVKLDGVLLVTSLDGRAVPVDPGRHVLTFEAAGKPSVEKTILLAEGEKARQVMAVMGAPVVVSAPATLVPLVPPGVDASISSGTSGLLLPESSTVGSTRLIGFVVGGVGVAGLIVGGVFGGLAFSKSSDSKKECNGPGGSCTGNTNPAAKSDSQTAGTFADVSTGMFIAGGALVATGVVLVLTGGSKKSATALQWSPTVLAHGGGMGLSGAW